MKLMIVDDEPDIREGIQDGIEWEELGIHKTLTAADAFEAQRIYKREQPEIGITDISMPRMSGIDLIGKLKEWNPHVRCILLSGYSEFEYAKKAIRLGVTAYELKPIKVARLKELITQLMGEIEAESSKESALKLNVYTDGQYFIKRLVKSKGVVGRDEYADGMKDLGLNDEDRVQCLYLQTDRYFHEQELPFDNKGHMEKFMGICGKWFGEKAFHFVKLHSDEGLILLQTEHSCKKIPQLFHELNEMTTADYQITFSMGASCEGGMQDFYILYTQSKTAVRNKIYTGRESLLYYSDESNNKKISNHYLVDTKMYEDIKQNYLDGDLKNVYGILDAKFEEIQKQRSYTYSALRDFCVDLINLLYRICQDYALHQCRSREAVIERMDDTCDTIAEFGACIRTAYEELYQRIKEQHYPTGNKVVKEMLDYMKKHYTEDLMIEEIAGNMGVTPNYLSHLFNKEIKLTFREFLNQYRVCKAKWYLENTNDKAYEIAEKVGFHEYKHFAQIFKKYEGCSTLQYRNQIGRRGKEGKG